MSAPAKATGAASPVPAGWEAVIGLEIHVQLRTQTKMFCRCANRYGDEPNTNVCPVCLAHPGMLPVPNHEAVRQAIRVGIALGCTIPEHAKFDRKNYFYPDSPKAYQISQYDEPLCARGSFHVPSPEGGFEVGITRAHLEEDAAKTIHHGGEGGRIAGAETSVVDFNRCGTPLLEIVTEPDLRTPEQARRFLNLLRVTIQTIGASDVDMEKGSLRCDANVSVRRAGATELGTKWELKNMNSFRFLERGITRAIADQVALLEAGDEVRQATLHYDPGADTLRILRTKEEAEDYRYFPEPDLVPLALGRDLVEELRASLPELPAARVERLQATYGVSEANAETIGLNGELADYYEAVVAAGAEPVAAANWVVNDFSAHLNATGLAPSASPVTPSRLAGLVSVVSAGTVGSAGAKQVFAGLVEDPAAGADALVERLGLAQVGDEAELGRIVDGVLAANESQVAQYRGGKTAIIGFLVGQAMKASGGRADPKVVQRLLRERLDA